MSDEDYVCNESSDEESDEEEFAGCVPESDDEHEESPFQTRSAFENSAQEQALALYNDERYIKSLTEQITPTKNYETMRKNERWVKFWLEKAKALSGLRLTLLAACNAEIGDPTTARRVLEKLIALRFIFHVFVFIFCSCSHNKPN